MPCFLRQSVQQHIGPSESSTTYQPSRQLKCVARQVSRRNDLLHIACFLSVSFCCLPMLSPSKVARLQLRPTYPSSGQASFYQRYDLLSRPSKWCTNIDRSIVGKERKGGWHYRHENQRPYEWNQGRAVPFRHHA